MRSLIALLSFSPILMAQGTPDPFRFVPADAAFVFRTKGPAGWRSELGATGLGKALSGGEIAASWKQLVDSAREEIDPEQEHTQSVQAMMDALVDYSGEVVVAGRVDFTAADLEQAPAFAMSFTLNGDGHSDLEAIGKQIASLLPEGGVERRLGSQDVQVHQVGALEWTAPFVSEGALVMLCGTSLEEQSAPFLEARQAQFAATPDLRRGVFGLQVEFHEPVRMALEAFARLEDENAKLMVRGLELAGVRSLQRLTACMFADGPYVAQEARCEWNDAARGLFDVVLPVRKSTPKLLAYLPPHVQNWSIGIFDVAALQVLYGKAFEEFGDLIPQSREEVEGAFTQYTKLRLHEDFLALFGGEYLRIEDFAAMGDTDTDVDPRLEKLDEKVGDACFVIQMKDGKAMAQNLEKALRARGLHAGRKTEDYGDTKVYRLSLLGSLPIEYAFAGEVFVLGIGQGEGTQRNVRSVLDMVAARAKGEVATELSAALQARMQGWPADWSTIDVGGSDEILDGFVSAIDGLLPMMAAEGLEPEDLGIWFHCAEFARKLRPALSRHGADVSVTAGYSARDVYMMRSRW